MSATEPAEEKTPISTTGKYRCSAGPYSSLTMEAPVGSWTPLGQALLNPAALKKSVSSISSTAVDQIAGESLDRLACNWQGHAIAPRGYQFPEGTTSSGPTLCGDYQNNAQDPRAQGTTPDTFYSVTMVADSGGCTAIPTNCEAGGVLSNPALETSCAGCAAQAVQSVVWVNISELASTNFSQVGGQPELTDLLGGLLLNSSGNVTGSLRPVTSELPTLGLSRQVRTSTRMA